MRAGGRVMQAAGRDCAAWMGPFIGAFPANFHPLRCLSPRHHRLPRTRPSSPRQHAPDVCSLRAPASPTHLSRLLVRTLRIPSPIPSHLTFLSSDPRRNSLLLANQIYSARCTRTSKAKSQSYQSFITTTRLRPSCPLGKKISTTRPARRTTRNVEFRERVIYVGARKVCVILLLHCHCSCSRSGTYLWFFRIIVRCEYYKFLGSLRFILSKPNRRWRSNAG